MTQPYRDLIVEEIDHLLKAVGSNDVQRQDGAAMLPRYLDMKQGTVVVKDSGVPLDSAEGRAWLHENKGFLLPPVHEESKADSAFLSVNMTKRQAFARSVGITEANRVAGLYGLRDIFDRRAGQAPGERGDKTKPAGNPWLDDSERGHQRRIDFIKACGAKAAASMAKSAGRTIDGKPLRNRAA